MVTKAIFLDRDGVLNDSILRNGKPHAPRHFSEYKLLPGVKEATQKLADAGFILLVVTNQPDIGNKLVDPAEVEKMNQFLLETLPISKIYMCPHTQSAGCTCRKPAPGMLFQGKAEFNIDMQQSYMVGDRYSDVQAGLAAKCQTIFIDYKYIETPDFSGSIRVGSLLEACQHLLA